MEKKDLNDEKLLYNVRETAAVVSTITAGAQGSMPSGR